MWTAADLLIRGVHCDFASIQARIEEVQRQCDAAAAALIVIMDGIVFKSLLAVSGHLLLTRLLEKSLDAEHWSAARSGSAGPERAEPVCERVLQARSLRELIVALGFASAAVAAREPDLRLDVFGMNAPQPRRAAVMIALVPREAIPLGTISSSTMEEVSLMVHGSLPVITRRQHMIERQCEDMEHEVETRLNIGGNSPSEFRRVELQSRWWQDQLYGQFAAAALGAAMAITNSRGGAFLRLKRDKQGLDFDDIIKERLPDIANDRAFLRACESAFASKQPYVVNPQPGGDGDVAYVAFPILFRRFESRERDVLAVLYLEKAVTTGEAGFGVTDLEGVRAIGVHLRTHRDWLRLVQSTTLLANLASTHGGQSNPLKEDLRPHVQLRTSDHVRADVAVDIQRVLPVEASRHEQSIADALLGLFHLTRSKSVALRLLTVNGRFLIRTCRFPKPASVPIDDSDRGYIFDVDRDWEQSANAWVVWKGLSCDVPDIRTLGERNPGLVGVVRVSRQDPLRCLYCAPVFSSGRIMGTVNVESVYPGAFATTKMLIEAVAAQIGQLLELGRDENERLLSVGSPMGSLTHAAVKLRSAVLELLPSTQTQQESDILKWLAVLTREVPAAQSNPASSGDPITLGQAIEQELTRQGLAGSACVYEHDELNERPFKSASGLGAFHTALAEMLMNARKRFPRIPHGQIDIVCRKRQRGGRQYICVGVGNPFDASPSDVLRPPNVTDYGRRPLDGRHRLHWGALLAGATLRRRLGGDLYVSRYALEGEGTEQYKSPYFQSTIEIPLQESVP